LNAVTNRQTDEWMDAWKYDTHQWKAEAQNRPIKRKSKW